MAKLSKESAEWHYKKLLALHYFEYLTLAQKVSIFYHDLEHDILKQITGKKEFFEQFKWLQNNQIRVERNIKTGEIPKVNIGDIDNLKNWRNEGIHENKMPEPKYRNHLHTMAQTICFFSELSIPDEINSIFNNQTENQKIKKIPSGVSKTNDGNVRNWKKGLRERYFNYMKERFSKNSDSFIETNFHDAFYIINDGVNAGMNLEKIILENKIPDDFIEKLEIDLHKRGKSKGRAKYYQRSLSFLLDFLEENPDQKYKQ